MKSPLPPRRPGQSRRQFLKSGSAAVAGLSLADYAIAVPATAPEKLASEGGPRSVTVGDKEHAALTRWPRYGQTEKEHLARMLDTNRFYDELPLFEKEWQAYTGSPFVKAHMNGTSALTSMFFALNLPPGSEIMVPSYTFFATCLAMRFFQCVPIFIDIDKRTGCFDLEDAKRKLTPRTKALVVMHSWGLPCEMDAIGDWAKSKGLLMLEDAAHAHGASMQGRKTGTWGAMGIFSYQASKVMPCVEGGMGMYQTREYFERAAAFGHYEDPVKFPAESPVRAYEGTGFGQKYRMHPFAAAIARDQLKRLDQQNAIVAGNIRLMNDELVQLSCVAEPVCRKDQKRVYYNGNMLLVDFAKLGVDRRTIVNALKAEGVRAAFWDYPEQHTLRIYAEPQWWHHPPRIPESMPGNAWINANHIFLPGFYEEAPDLAAQYVKAFQKVWARKDSLAQG